MGCLWLGTAYIFNLDSIIYFRRCLQSYTDPQTGKVGEAVYNIYTIPKQFIETKIDEFAEPDRFVYYGQQFPKSYDYTISKPSTIDGYTPINKKLLTYPYCYFVLSNNNGSSNVFHYEKFQTSDCEFKIKGVPVVGGSIKCIPNFYGDPEVNDFNEEEGVVCGKFPALNWSQNEYYNWLRQNGANLQFQTASSAFATGFGVALAVGGFATGQVGLGLAGVGIAGGGISGMGNALVSNYEHSLTPASAKGNINAGDINVSTGANGFYFYNWSIKEEFARRLDKYFSIAGYRTNLVKLPNITGRTNWNFVKTIDCNIEGTEIPEKDINKLKSMFNSGITFWHNYSTFRDYSQTNSIVT